MVHNKSIGRTNIAEVAAVIADAHCDESYRAELNAILDYNEALKRKHGDKEAMIAFLTALDSGKAEHLELTHPQRTKISECAFCASLMLGEYYFITAYLASKCDIPMSDALAFIRYTDEKSKEALNTSGGVDGGIHDGNNMITTAPLYHQFRNGATLVFDDNLMQELDHTDLSKGVSVETVIPPFNSCFIAFGETASALGDKYTLYNALSGEHPLEGAYVNTYPMETPTELMPHCEPLQINKDSDLICMEVMFTGRPKERILNDASHHVNLYFDLNSELCASEQLKNNLAYYIGLKDAPEAILALSNLERERLEDERAHRQTIEHFDLLAKLLVYLNCADVRKVNHKPVAALEKQLKGLKNAKKQRRIKAQLLTAMDYTLITSQAEPLDLSIDTEPTGSGKRPHWRRGYLRNQRYGKGRTQTRAKHIRPVLVNRSQLGKGTMPAKTYKVQ